jgi:hypothetical protein
LIYRFCLSFWYLQTLLSPLIYRFWLSFWYLQTLFIPELHCKH